MYTVLLYSNVKILAFHEMISAGTFSLAKVHHYFELAKKIDIIEKNTTEGCNRHGIPPPSTSAPLLTVI